MLLLREVAGGAGGGGGEGGGRGGCGGGRLVALAAAARIHFVIFILLFGAGRMEYYSYSYMCNTLDATGTFFRHVVTMHHHYKTSKRMIEKINQVQSSWKAVSYPELETMTRNQVLQRLGGPASKFHKYCSVKVGT